MLSNNDGCAVARSAEAKALGIKMGAPYFQLQDLITHEGLVTFSSNYALYANISARIMTILEQMAPELEIYSLDEAFVDLTGMDKNIGLERFGRELKDRVYQWTGIPCCAGIAPTKTLAKLANRGAKKYPATGGVVDLSCEVRQRKLMALTEVGDVWGIGRRLTARLNAIGINTALDLASADPLVIGKDFNVNVERTVRELNGESCMSLEVQPPAKKQIVCSRSFGKKITQLDMMRQAIASFVERAGEKLRTNQSTTASLTVFIRTSPFMESEPQYSNVASHKYITATDDTRVLLKEARRLLEGIWREGYRFAKAGVMLSDFYDKGTVQQQLFEPEPVNSALMSVIDEINQRGIGRVSFAGQGTHKEWEMRRDLLSPSYTTRWDQLPVVK